MTWKEYLIAKNIDPDRFKSGENMLYREFDLLFNQLHPDSFTAQKLYLINKLRRKYKLEKTVNEPIETKPIKAKPRMVPRIKK